MGCICGKEAETFQDDAQVSEKHHGSRRRSSASGRLNYFVDTACGKERERVVPNGNAVAHVVPVDHRKENQWMPSHPNPRLSNPPKHVQGEQIAAGWPAWLSAVAGDAIRGWIPRRADSFEKLDKIGQGTYSNVYKARDLETGKIVALKKVRFDSLEPESVRFMAREIQVLRRLDHPNVVKLEGLVTSRMSCSLYLVFEYMEHDLAGLAASPGTAFTEPQVKCYLQQLLQGLEHCHSRGVLHRDIKGSNLLLDNGGILKIADFGLATFYHPDQRQPLTSRVVTLWYRPPELLLGATEYGAAVDLWSTGCILAELLAGKPIMPGRTEVEQLHKIFKLCGSPSEEYWKKSKLPHATIFKPKQPYKRCIAETFKDFPQSALSTLETLLAIEPADRGTASSALKSEFFTTKPLACDPSSLPKYPPSKEFDAKVRDEEARRQRTSGTRGHGTETGKKATYTSKAVPAPDANAESAISIQKRRLSSHAASKSKSEKFNPKQDDSAVGFPIDPPRPAETIGGTTAHTVLVHSDGVGNVGTAVRKQKEGIPSFPQSHSSVFITDSDAGGSNSTVSRSSRNSSQHSAVHEGVQVRKHGFFESSDSFKLHKESQRLETLSKGREDAKESARHDLSALVLAKKADRIHFSGPLLRPSANFEHMLGEHERQVQQAVRRSRMDREKPHRHQQPIYHNSWVTGINEQEGAPELTFIHGVPPNSGSGRWKTQRTPIPGEITERGESARGLSAVAENYEEHEL
ncbi:hypothetical protein KP509_08G060900 [Ceratopteris richardii]|uniref:Protein kinase domain-containing protein n=1 Tax=Ceratopteris richardii TaxID=49495 RepID=A0A8T2UAX1_CERRI|nr:hypothetical protein KP509_08G060900 [Ceratopteris richardii]